MRLAPCDESATRNAVGVASRAPSSDLLQPPPARSPRNLRRRLLGPATETVRRLQVPVDDPSSRARPSSAAAIGDRAPDQRALGWQADHARRARPAYRQDTSSSTRAGAPPLRLVLECRRSAAMFGWLSDASSSGFPLEPQQATGGRAPVARSDGSTLIATSRRPIRTGQAGQADGGVALLPMTDDAKKKVATYQGPASRP